MNPDTKKYFKWAGIGILILVFTIGVLSLVGSVFIEEITTDVVLTPPKKTVSTAGSGEEAPQWELAGPGGNVITLSDFSGKPLVLTFWTTWNPLAVDQLRIFDEYLSNRQAALFNIAAINNQEESGTVFNFIRRSGYQVSVILDESGAVSELYNAHTLPTTYFIDAKGTVRDIFTGVLTKDILLEKITMLF